MIRNNWNKALDEAGRKQSEFAEAFGINKGTFSAVCSGQRVMPLTQLYACAQALGCAPHDIYAWRVLNVLYGIKKPRAPRAESAKKSIAIDAELLERIDPLVEDRTFGSRAEAVEFYLRKTLDKAEGVAL